MRLTSKAFKNSEKINAKNTVQGEDISPPLSNLAEGQLFGVYQRQYP